MLISDLLKSLVLKTHVEEIEIFILTRRMFFGDSRPDSTGYNHGYTGDVNPVSYSRIAENSLI
jgi:hypothetical protein